MRASQRDREKIRTPTSRRSSSGGAGGAGGHDYAARVAAYYGVAMLAEQSNVLGWGIPAGVTVESVAAETAEAVDDQRLGLSDGSRVLLQAKRQTTAATNEGSPLEKTAVEFVRQHLADGGQASPLVLVCGPASSGPIKEALPRMLERLRGEPPADAHDLESTNEQQRSSYDALVAVLERAWQAQTGAPAPASDLVALLSRIHVTVLAVEEGGGDEANAMNNLARPSWREPRCGRALAGQASKRSPTASRRCGRLASAALITRARSATGERTLSPRCNYGRACSTDDAHAARIPASRAPDA